jgi:hypothetical protein
LEDPGRFTEDIVVILPGEVTSPKEVESDLVRGEDERKVDIYDTSGKGGGFGDGRHALSFIVVGR